MFFILFFHEPWNLAFALKAPRLKPIKEYVELEVERYKKELGISVPPIHRDTIVCDIPFRKRLVDNTRTISCVINGEQCDKMLFDSGANYMQITPEIATRIGITEDDVIGSQLFDLANGDIYSPQGFNWKMTAYFRDGTRSEEGFVRFTK